MSLRVVEASRFNEEQKTSFVNLFAVNVTEAMPKLEYVPARVADLYEQITKDDAREKGNIWLVSKDDFYIGYSIGHIDMFPYNNDNHAFLSYIFVLPAFRGSWAAIKMVRVFEDWARQANALHIYLAVARVDKDNIKHIRQLFPRMGYKWSGSYFVKET